MYTTFAHVFGPTPNPLQGGGLESIPLGLVYLIPNPKPNPNLNLNLKVKLE